MSCEDDSALAVMASPFGGRRRALTKRLAPQTNPVAEAPRLARIRALVDCGLRPQGSGRRASRAQPTPLPRAMGLNHTTDALRRA